MTRIEGHAKISIFMDDAGNVSDAEFHVVEFRGFEKFCEGRPYSEMPGITPRICGICPVSHLLASAKAGDAIMAVSIPPAADKLRRLMNLGQIIQSHALSFFHLSAPDFLLGWDTPPAKRNVFGLIAANTDLARAGIRLRQFGQEIIAVLGGKKIHPAWAVPGGVRSPLTEEGRARIRAWLPEAYATTKIAFDLFKKTHGHPQEGNPDLRQLPVALHGPGRRRTARWEHHGGKLRFTDSSGSIIADQLDPQKYYEYIGESVQSASYLKSPYYMPLGFPDGMYRVGPLARLNVAEHMGTPKADAELKKFKKLGAGARVTSSFLYHYARLIEILACLECVERCHGRPGPAERRPARRRRHQQPARASARAKPRAARCSTTTPWTATACCKKVNLIVATGQNNLAMNQTVAQIARHYVQGNNIPEPMLNRVEHGIRCYDPCLSCSTHAVGQMPLHVQLIAPDGTVLNEIARG